MNQQARGTADLVRFPAAALGALQEVLREELGAAQAARALRRLGVESGSALYDSFRESVAGGDGGSTEPDQLSPDEFWPKLGEFLDGLGWGRIHPEPVHPGVLEIRVEHGVETRAGSGRSGSHLTAGLIAEILSHVAQVELAALELGATDAGAARILVGSRETLDALYAKLSSGRGYPEALADLG